MKELEARRPTRAWAEWLRCIFVGSWGSAAGTAFLLFGVINLFDVLDNFGWQAVDLPPLQFQLFSDWVAVRNFVGHTLLAVAPVYLLGRAARWLLVPAFVFVFGIEAVSKYTEITWHASLSDIWISLLLNSSIEEAVSFMKAVLTPMSALGLLVFALALVVGVRALLRAKYPRRSVRTLVCGIALTLPFFVLNVLAMNWHFGMGQMRYTSFVVSSVMSVQKMKGVASACANARLPEHLPLAVDGGQTPDVIIVLGESETRDNWHLYGYPRQTTPRMDALCAEGGGGICFRDVVCFFPATVEAICTMLTDVSPDDLSVGSWTLAEAYRRAGFRSVLISNNQFACNASMTGFLNRIFSSCEDLISVNAEFPDDRKAQGKVFDERTAELLRRELAKSDSRPRLVFVHLAGIHYPVHNVNPKADNRFSDEVESECLQGLDMRLRDRRNRYDNGILYEDKVRGMLVDVVKRECRRPACLVFISDHGESPRAQGWRDFADEDTYEVPMVVWFSETYRDAFPETVRRASASAIRSMQSDELTFGLLELGQIKDAPGWTSEKNFLAPNFKGRFPRRIDKGRRVYSKDEE